MKTTLRIVCIATFTAHCFIAAAQDTSNVQASAIPAATTSLATPLIAPGLQIVPVTKGSTVAPGTYACEIVYEGARGGFTTPSTPSQTVTVNTPSATHLYCAANEAPAGSKCFDTYWQTGGNETFHLGHTCTPFDEADIQTTTPPISGPTPPTSSTAVATLATPQSNLSGRTGSLTVPSTALAAEGNPGEPAVGQIITDQRNGSFMQSCSLGSIHGGLAQPAQDYCFYQSDAVPLLAPTQNFRGVSAGVYQGFLHPPPFNNSEGAGTSSTAGFFANYRGHTATPANTNGIWALNTYTYYENHAAPSYGYELDMNNASKKDDSGTNDAVALEILNGGNNKVGYAVSIGTGFENGVFIAGASNIGLRLAPGMANGISNESTTNLFNNLYLFPSKSGPAWASPVSFGSQILNASGAQAPDTYVVTPNGGSGRNPYTTLSFTHPVAAGSGPSYYTFDSPVIAYGGVMLNPNTPVIPNTATGWTGSSAGKVVLAFTGHTGTINGTPLSASCDSGTATITGAAVGHPVAVSSTTGADIGGAFSLRASVTAPNTITVYICGNGTPPSLAYNVTVF